eukprot:augustus_masked-scaffold_65-processed-gene-0.52-mRNA-1 protein AED:0.97 eAED:0.98 QI:0/-1/0/1/-1/1/1/0/106
MEEFRFLEYEFGVGGNVFYPDKEFGRSLDTMFKPRREGRFTKETLKRLVAFLRRLKRKTKVVRKVGDVGKSSLEEIGKEVEKVEGYKLLMSEKEDAESYLDIVSKF